MAKDALLEACAHMRFAPLDEGCAPWDMVPRAWYASASYTRCPIGAELDEDANEPLGRALAGADPEALSPQDEAASELARQVMEALTRCKYFWCVDRAEDGRPTCSRGHRGRLTPQKTWLRDTRLQDPHPEARRSSKSEVSIEVAPDGPADF